MCQILMSQEVMKLAILRFPFLQRAPEDGIKTIMLLFVLQTSSGGTVNSNMPLHFLTQRLENEGTAREANLQAGAISKATIA